MAGSFDLGTLIAIAHWQEVGDRVTAAVIVL
jgi:hypothetical protein